MIPVCPLQLRIFCDTIVSGVVLCLGVGEGLIPWVKY